MLLSLLFNLSIKLGFFYTFILVLDDILFVCSPLKNNLENGKHTYHKSMCSKKVEGYKDIKFVITKIPNEPRYVYGN